MTKKSERASAKADKRIDVETSPETAVSTTLGDFADEAEEFQQQYLTEVSRPDYPDRLQAAAKLLLADPENFESGELVTWKPGLQNRLFPAERAPAIVVGISIGRTSTETDPSSPMFNEALDLQLGIIDGDGDFIVFHYDRRRFTHWRSTRD